MIIYVYLLFQSKNVDNKSTLIDCQIDTHRLSNRHSSIVRSTPMIIYVYLLFQSKNIDNKSTPIDCQIDANDNICIFIISI